MYSPVSNSENSFSPRSNENNEKNKGNTKHNRRESSDSVRSKNPKSSEYFTRRNHIKRNRTHKKKNNYHTSKRSINERREFSRKHHYKTYNTFDKRESSATQTSEVFDKNLLKSLVSTNLNNNFNIQKESIKCLENEVEYMKKINVQPGVVDSLTKSSVKISSKDQILKITRKMNVLNLPMPPTSTNSFDCSLSPEIDPKEVTDKILMIPIPPEKAQEKIIPGESYIKDNNYKNIKASAFFSPTTKERPSKIVPKRPSVIKSTPPIDYPNRDISEFNKLLKVGEGSYGTVYKALDIRSNEIVAMKRVKMEHEHEGFPITAIREIKILRQLNHKNVINLREIISDQKDYYLVFEYMNHDLMGLLENDHVCFNEQSIFSIIKQILEGLEYCHSKNFLHRDLKCSNILLNNKGEVKLGDFGLSRFYNAAFPDRPYTNKVISLWYRPIELLLGEESYGFAIDIWSCGCILAELFSRRPLFLANTEVELIEVITNLCGTPFTTDWPEVRKLPQYRTIALKPKPRRLLEVYKQVIPDLALLLLDQMLQLNPMKRITASEALKSLWIIFNSNKSLTSAPLSLPSWIDCHELQAKMKQKDKS